MRSILLQDNQPTGIRSHIKSENPAEAIAGFFYYSSAVILWTTGIAGLLMFLIYFLMSPGFVFMLLILALIYGLPGWVWAAIGVVLYRCHKHRYNSEMYRNDALLMWSGTIVYNALQAAVIYYAIGDTAAGNAIGGWNLIAAALAAFAFYFDFKNLNQTNFW